MEKNKKNKLVRQLGIPSTIVVLVVFGSLFFSTIISFRAEQDEARALARREAENINKQISAFLTSTSDDLRLVAGNVGEPPFTSQLSSLFLQDIIKSNFTILELTFFDSNGLEILNFSQPTTGRVTQELANVSDNEFFRQSMAGKEYLGDPFLSDFQIPFVFWSFPIKNSEGGVVGVLRSTIDLSTLWGTISNFTSQQNGQAYIVDDKGVLLVRNDLSDVKNQESLEENPIVASFLSGNKSILRYNGLGGSQVFGFWEQISPTPWAVIAEIPASLAFTNAYQNILIFGALIIVVALLFVYELLLFRSKYAAPFSKFRKTVSKFGTGDFSARVKINSGNELDDLAVIFNQMAKNIEDNTNVIVEKMKKIATEQETASKMLIRRDMELTQANERLRELDKIKSEFLSIAAHQLRTPLSGVKWVLKLLIDGDAGHMRHEQRELIVKAYENNERMINLVNDMLDVDRLEAGRYRFSYRPTHLEDVLDNVLLTFTERMKNQNIKLNYSRPKPILPLCMIDPEKVGEVFKNLIDNALKYTMKAGSINIEMNQNGKFVETKISDTGIGIPAEQVEKIFIRFYRGSNAKKFVADGSGLGLSIAKDIIERHGGHIWLESEVNKGSNFYFTVPIAKSNKEV